MHHLDDPDQWRQIDPSGMRTLVETLPEQIRKAAGIASAISFVVPSGIRAIVLAGLGGSAIGGDVVRSVTGNRMSVPFQVSRDYDLPGFVGPHVPVITSSYSGNTEETLSAYRLARSARAPVICISSGGRLAELARTDGSPLILLPPGLPPRTALGFSTLALLGCLRALELVPDMSCDIEETARILDAISSRCAVAVPQERNPAKQMAESMLGNVVAVYAASGLLEAAAMRWRGQIEENAKNLAFHHLLPEMNHNELVGWENPAPVLRRCIVIMLRDREEHPQVKRRFDLTEEILQARACTVHQVRSKGESRLARIFSVMLTGDFVSLYLAALNRVDPTPVTIIETLKARLTG